MGWLALDHHIDHGVIIGDTLSVIVRAISPSHNAIIEVRDGSNPPFLCPLLYCRALTQIASDAFVRVNEKQHYDNRRNYQIKIRYLAPPEVRISRHNFGSSSCLT